MEMDINTPCPKCAKTTLKKRFLSNGKYTIICVTCGYSTGELEDDIKKGVV